MTSMQLYCVIVHLLNGKRFKSIMGLPYGRIRKPGNPIRLEAPNLKTRAAEGSGKLAKIPKYSAEDNNLLIFISIKLKEWQDILNRKDLTKKEKDEIRDKLKRIFNLMYGAHHKSLKETDELVTKYYDCYLESLQTLKQEYQLLSGQGKSYPLMLPWFKEMIESFPFKLIQRSDADFDSLEEKLHYLLETPSNQLATEFTAKATQTGEDYVRKKIKKIYRKDKKETNVT